MVCQRESLIVLCRCERQGGVTGPASGYRSRRALSGAFFTRSGPEGRPIGACMFSGRQSSFSISTLSMCFLGSCFLVFSLLLFFIFYAGVPSMLLRTEQSYLKKQLNIVSGVLEVSRFNTYVMAHDLGDWDATARYVRGGYPDFFEDNWSDVSLLELYRFNFVIFTDRQGSALYTEFHDYLEHKPLPVPDGFAENLKPLARGVLAKAALPLADDADVKSRGAGGFLLYNGVPYYVACMPIKALDESGAPGTVLLGYVMGNDEMRKLTHISSASFDFVFSEDAEFTGSPISRESDTVVASVIPYNDTDGKPVFLRMSEERTIYLAGSESVTRTALLLLGAMALFGAAMLFVVSRLAVRPIVRLSNDIRSGKFTSDTPPDSYAANREFVALCRAISGMLSRLEESSLSLGTLQRVLDGLDALIFVSDPETDAMFFANAAMKKAHNLPESVKGLYCYRATEPGWDHRCPACQKGRLVEGEITEWEQYQEETGRYFRKMDSLIEWVGGAKAHLQCSVDITAIKTAKEVAERSSMAKGEFLSRMSHEMRTPLNAIIGMTSIAKSSNELEKKIYCLDKIEDASNHLLGVINDILDMSKIEAKKFDLVLEEFPFEKMLMRVVNVVNYRIDEKEQNFIVNIDKNVPYAVISDEQRLTQVITNLLANAVKFTPEKGTITLSARTVEDRGDEVTLQIEVADTGIGITEEQQARLFASFEQADGGINRKYGGTGLGLAISRSIVDLMGGAIWIESVLGQGSTFAFTLNARKGTEERKKLLGSSVNWSSLRILAVDDAPEVREYFLNLAESIGLDCEVAADGEEAAAILSANTKAPFNIIFADWKMPGMNGIELTRHVRETYGSQVVVIMISAAEWETIEKDAKEAGVDKFVPKPLFASLIVDCITESLGTRHLADECGPNGLEDGIFTGRRILLAEDIEINREIVLSLLQNTGLAIDCAVNGEEAVRMFEAAPSSYSMIFMDIHMPEVDGYEATRRIRALDLPEADSIPIVAMTANVFKEDIERCLAAGMNDHVGKPVDVDEIYRTLKRYIDGCE